MAMADYHGCLKPVSDRNPKVTYMAWLYKSNMHKSIRMFTTHNTLIVPSQKSGQESVGIHQFYIKKKVFNHYKII